MKGLSRIQTTNSSILQNTSHTNAHTLQLGKSESAPRIVSRPTSRACLGSGPCRQTVEWHSFICYNLTLESRANPQLVKSHHLPALFCAWTSIMIFYSNSDASATTEENWGRVYTRPPSTLFCKFL